MRTSESRSLSTPANLHILRALARHLQPQETLEIGLAFGGSAMALLNATDAHHTAIDPWQTSVWNGEALQVIEAAGRMSHFTLIEEGSETALPRLLAHGKNFDLIYVDGAHTFEHVVRDALYAIDLLRVGGVVVFDDCTMQAIRKTLRFLRRNYDGIVQEMDLDPFRPPLSIARRVAHYVGYTQARAFQRTRSGGRDWNARFRDF